MDETAPVDVSVRWNANLAAQLVGATVEVIIKPVLSPAADEESPDSGTPVMTEQRIQLIPLEGAPERYAARLPELKPGSYEVWLNTQD